LLTLFAAWHFRDLVACPEYEAFVEDKPLCVMHINQKVARRLNTLT
jgi:hypothetical protein